MEKIEGEEDHIKSLTDFEVGDSVIYTNSGGHDWPGFCEGNIYTIVNISGKINGVLSDTVWFNIEGMSDSMGFGISQFRSATVKDTKIARAFYKNNIKEIKDGKIYLKS